MSSNYIIREANDTDYPQILGIYRYYWDKHFENLPDDYAKVLSYLKEAFDKRQEYFNFWVCDNGEGEIYGWLSCLQVFNSPLRKDYNGELSIYTRYDKQNGIIAGKLSHRVVNEILANTPLMVLWAHIDSKNISSQKLTTRFGFKKEINVLPNSKFYEYDELWIKTYKNK